MKGSSQNFPKPDPETYTRTQHLPKCIPELKFAKTRTKIFPKPDLKTYTRTQNLPKPERLTSQNQIPKFIPELKSY